jgi:hypothetical protein
MAAWSFGERFWNGQLVGPAKVVGGLHWHANDTLKYVYKYMSKPQQQSPIESSAAVVTTARDDVACTSVHVVACVALGCRARDPC